MTGIIKGYEIKKNRDGLKNVLMLQCEISGPDDVQSIQYMSAAGDNQIPPIGSLVYILSAGRSWKIAISSLEDNDFDSSLSEGERQIKMPSGSYVRLNNDGTIELNGNSNNAVTYAALNAGLQAMLTAINANLALKLDGAGAPGTSTLDISGAEENTVKLP
jgi:phage gp45-like